MNIKKIRKQLKKINTLFSAIEEEGYANSIEKDLMKTYILTLYEQVIQNEEPISEASNEMLSKTEKKVAKRKIKQNPSDSIFTENHEMVTVEEKTLETIVEKEYKSEKNGTSTVAIADSVIDLVEEEVELEETIVESKPISDERFDVLFQSDLSLTSFRTPA